MRTHSLTTAAAAAFLAAMPAYAQVATWTGSTSGNWNTNGNWSPATVPTSTAIFDNTGLNQSLNISANASINTMPFNAGAPAYSFTFNSSYGLHHCWLRHRQHLFECADFFGDAHSETVVHQ